MSDAWSPGWDYSQLVVAWAQDDPMTIEPGILERIRRLDWDDLADQNWF
jgi:hypothetical protein